METRSTAKHPMREELQDKSPPTEAFRNWNPMSMNPDTFDLDDSTELLSESSWNESLREFLSAENPVINDEWPTWHRDGEPSISEKGTEGTYSKSFTTIDSTSQERTDSRSIRKSKSPMVDRTDATRERRRMQVRQAQRAYRLRGQAKSAALNERVAELEDTIKNLGNAYFTLRRNIMRLDQRSLPSAVLLFVQQATDQILSEMRRANIVPNMKGDSASICMITGPTAQEPNQLGTERSSSQIKMHHPTSCEHNTD